MSSHVRCDGVPPAGIPSCSCGRAWPCPEAAKLPDHIESGLRNLLGIPTNQLEALRRLETVLREARGLAVATDADHGNASHWIDMAIKGTQRDRERAEASALAAAVYHHPEVM